MSADTFTLKFEYKGHPHILDVHAVSSQYKTVYKVTVEEHEITFEPDEEGYVRAVKDNPLHEHSKSVDVALLHHVAELIVAHIQ
ncbi:MAG TPA: hypothetical protein VM802_17780 [Chitinophaga sp.]|uniref:hypothetical protein n=1 Tax=Chitinophaga sp. TaxID=1869181 RepID=UPI002CA3D5E2|nr:hypothetical protein [Chitinophaga sp.]HVI46734.1 hypothetical protein [Chitinophaga sp.]